MAQSRPINLFIVIGTLTVASACSPKPPSPPPAPSSPQKTEPALVLPVPPPPVLNRADLLSAVAQAAESFAVKADYPQSAVDLDGRRFSVKLPFGCFGPTPQAGLGYVFDEKKQTLKVSATPTVWKKDDPLYGQLSSPDTEAIEGFWVQRPWISTDACPADNPPPGPQQAPPTVGLARVFDKGGSRLLRRGSRPYEVVRKSDAAPGPGGFRLVLEGRVTGGGDNQPIRCWSDDANQRPSCVVRVEFDRVAIENPAGDLLGEWSN